MGEVALYKVGEREGSGYLAFPHSGQGPGIIVIQEWWGLVGHIKNVVDRFANAGFIALAPDLYHGKIANEPDTARKLMMELELDRAADEIDIAAKYLAALPHNSKREIGTVGFCMGGALSIMSASTTQEVTKSVAFYPSQSWERHEPEWSGFKGKSVLIHCAEGDGTSAAPGIQTAKRKIASAGGNVVTFDYPGTAHAFFNEDRPEVFNQDAANLAWDRTLEFLKS